MLCTNGSLWPKFKRLKPDWEPGGSVIASSLTDCVSIAAAQGSAACPCSYTIALPLAASRRELLMSSEHLSPLQSNHGINPCPSHVYEYLSVGGWGISAFCQLTVHFVPAPALDAPPCCCFGVFTYLCYLHILQDQLLCNVLRLFFFSSFPLHSWTAVIFLQRGVAGVLACKNAHPLSKRRLQLTIVGFHHRHECAASLLMACQRIFFTPVIVLSALPLPVALTAFCTLKLIILLAVFCTC